MTAHRVRISSWTSKWNLRFAVSACLALILLSPYALAAPGLEAKPEKVLVQSYTQDFFTLDPPLTTRLPDYPVISQLFNALVRYKPGSAELEPDLAERWNVSSDGLTYTFWVRRGACAMLR